MRSDVGAPIRRVEDRRLLTGGGRYLDDVATRSALAAYVLRSTMPHARFALDGLDAARAHPGVRLILTSDDLAQLGSMPMRNSAPQPDGRNPVPPPHPPLAREIVRHVGEPIAFVVADTLPIAKDAAELIRVDYRPLPVVVDGRAALEPGAPVLRPDRGSNQAYEYHLGDAAKVDAAFAGAARVVKIRAINNRVAAGYLETRGAIGEYDPATRRYTLTAGTQGGHVVKRMMADEILKIEQARLRVVTPDVGGAFGVKMFTYPEYPLSVVAAERAGRPVKWIGERMEHFQADNHGRDNDSIAEMALDKDGRFLAIRIDTVVNIGAYCSEMGAWVPFAGHKMTTGCYDIPLYFARVRGAYTNTMTVDAYRGAGRPEAAYLIERLVDACAAEIDADPIALRRLNLIGADQMPYAAATGWKYDSGDFARHLDRALEVAGYKGFEARARGPGRLRGIGVAVHIDACAPAGVEPATMTLDADGGVTLLIGTQSGGHGHATSYGQYITAALGVGYDKVRVVQGDTDRIAKGGGTGGSRSMPLGAPSVELASRTLVARIKTAASRLLEAAVGDLELVDGTVRVAGTDRAMSFADIARATNTDELTVVEGVEVKDRTYPNGTHVSEVEIDTDTGRVTLVAHTIVDDVGRVINPLLLEGQIHGGVAQGAGQALLEQVRYDSDGQLVTGSLLDYCLPRATDMPMFSFDTRNTPATANPLGVKGVGEAGVMGSCPAVMNAVADALRRAGSPDWIDMPATPERIWERLRTAARLT